MEGPALITALEAEIALVEATLIHLRRALRSQQMTETALKDKVLTALKTRQQQSRAISMTKIDNLPRRY